MKKVFIMVIAALMVASFAAFAATAPTVTSNSSEIGKLQSSLSALQTQVNGIPALSVWAQAQYDFDVNAGTLTPDMGIWAELSFGGFDFAGWYYGTLPGPIGGGSVAAQQYSGSYTLPKMGDLSLTTKLGVFRIWQTLDYLSYWNGTPIYEAGNSGRINYLSVTANTSNFNVTGAINTTTSGSPLVPYVVGSANFSPVKLVFAMQNTNTFNVGGQATFKPVTVYAGANMTSGSTPTFEGGAKVDLPAGMSLTGIYYNGNFPNGGNGVLAELNGSMGSAWSYWVDVLYGMNETPGYSEGQLGVSFSATDNLTIQFVADNTGSDTTGYIAYQYSF